MKLKSLVMTSLALGVLTTGVATLLDKEVSATQYDQSYKENNTFIPYTITTNGNTTLSLTDFAFPKDSLVNHYDIIQKIKAALKSDRGIDENTLNKVKSAEYKIHFKNGEVKTFNLKSNHFDANLFSTDLIKEIDINIHL